MKRKLIAFCFLASLLHHVGHAVKATRNWTTNQAHCEYNDTPSRWNKSCPQVYAPEQRGPVKPYWAKP